MRLSTLPLLCISLLAGCASGQPTSEKLAASLPRVLIIGDSISIGYTPHVRTMLDDEAIVVRPMLNEKNAENCEGTTKGLANIDRWLAESPWDVIHFNWGLHDLKFVDEDGRNSTADTGSRQADIEQYKNNLRQLVRKLRRTGASLIFATTTPVPEDGVPGPLRLPGDSKDYNTAAVAIMEAREITVNDLHAFVVPRAADIQHPRNVHFSDDGSRALAGQVASAIRNALEQRASD